MPLKTLSCSQSPPFPTPALPLLSLFPPPLSLSPLAPAYPEGGRLCPGTDDTIMLSDEVTRTLRLLGFSLEDHELKQTFLPFCGFSLECFCPGQKEN